MAKKSGKKNKDNKRDENDTNLAAGIKNLKMNYGKGGMAPSESQKKPPKISKERKEEMEKVKKKLEDFKKKVVKKYSFVKAIGIIPPQASKKIEEEENVPKKVVEKKPIHLAILVPKDKLKKIDKVDLIKKVEKLKPKIWLHIKTTDDIWEYYLDGKSEISSAIAMSFPLYDDGFLGCLRVAEIHKSLVLRKFEKYVTSYVIAGSLVRGEETKTSDVDVYVVINDTDVKRMSRLELKEKLRNIIYSYVLEASELAGVKNKLSPQVYILTEFWEGVKDANPVFFTFIRDGIPLYDKGTFMPWKLLLKMGKITPSPESIDKFMAIGDKVEDRVKKGLTNLVIRDLYWGILTPSQALLMLYGKSPPTPKETPKLFLDTFVKNEKLLEKKYANILKRMVKVYKDYEHGKVKEISGKRVDKFLKDSKEYIKRLKVLRKQIEKATKKKTVKEVYKNLFDMLKESFGKKGEKALISEFEERFIKGGNLPKSYLEDLKYISKMKKKSKGKTKLSRGEVQNVRKKADSLVNHLIEYNQRCELVGVEKGRARLEVEGKDEKYELVLTDKANFLIRGNKVNRIDLKKKKLIEVDASELTKALNEQKKRQEIDVDSALFDFLRSELGKFKFIL